MSGSGEATDVEDQGANTYNHQVVSSGATSQAPVASLMLNLLFQTVPVKQF